EDGERTVDPTADAQTIRDAYSHVDGVPQERYESGWDEGYDARDRSVTTGGAWSHDDRAREHLYGDNVPNYYTQHEDEGWHNYESGEDPYPTDPIKIRDNQWSD